MKPCTLSFELLISADNEALRTGVATSLSRGRYGGNPLRHENLWNFDGDIRPTRRYRKAPEAWGRKANYSERYCASKLEVSLSF